MRITGLLIVVLVVFLSIGIVTHIQTNNFGKNNKKANSKTREKINPVIENVYLNNTYLYRSSAISINGNSDFQTIAQSHTWTGNGSKDNPYLIHNIFFSDRFTNPDLIDLSIQNTNVFVNIQNVYLEFLRLSSQPSLRAGIKLENCSHVAIQNVYVISSINNNNAHMIDISNCSQITIQRNYFNTTLSAAIYIQNSSHINITSNFLKNNFVGISLGFSTSNIAISTNTFQRNSLAVESTKNNIDQVTPLDDAVTNNYFENNTRSIDISGGNFGIIQGNILQDLSYKDQGMNLQRAINTVVKDNSLIGFKIGIELDQLQSLSVPTSDCSSTNALPECLELGNTSSTYFTLHQSNVTITGNEFVNQTQKSLLIQNYTDGNIIYDNNFIAQTINTAQAQVQVGLGQNITNSFSKNGLGNYWTNYNGSDPNKDGIGDSPYKINQNISDPNPLMKPANVSKPVVKEANELSYLKNLQVGATGGTTSEQVPNFPTIAGQPINIGTSGISGRTTTGNNNMSKEIVTGLINIGIVGIIAGGTLAGLLVVGEYRTYTKTKESDSFRRHLSKKVHGNKKTTKPRLYLSEKVFEELEEIIVENKEK